MNVKRILSLADMIERDDTPGLVFSMSSFARYSECGTIACIAGWAAYMSAGLLSHHELLCVSDPYQVATEYLGLNVLTAGRLFLRADSSITAKDAATVLRRLAATGQVNWSHRS